MAAYVELDGKQACSICIYLLLFYNVRCTRTVKYTCGLVKVFVYQTFTDEVIEHLLD